jgi:hypothetical protein
VRGRGGRGGEGERGRGHDWAASGPKLELSRHSQQLLDPPPHTNPIAQAACRSTRCWRRAASPTAPSATPSTRGASLRAPAAARSRSQVRGRRHRRAARAAAAAAVRGAEARGGCPRRPAPPHRLRCSFRGFGRQRAPQPARLVRPAAATPQPSTVRGSPAAQASIAAAARGRRRLVGCAPRAATGRAASAPSNRSRSEVAAAAAGRAAAAPAAAADAGSLSVMQLRCVTLLRPLPCRKTWQLPSPHPLALTPSVPRRNPSVRKSR